MSERRERFGAVNMDGDVDMELSCRERFVWEQIAADVEDAVEQWGCVVTCPVAALREVMSVPNSGRRSICRVFAAACFGVMGCRCVGWGSRGAGFGSGVWGRWRR